MNEENMKKLYVFKCLNSYSELFFFLKKASAGTHVEEFEREIQVTKYCI